MPQQKPTLPTVPAASATPTPPSPINQAAPPSPATEIASKPTTAAAAPQEELNGLLLIRVVEARGIAFPTNASMPASNSDEKNMPYCLIEFDKNQIMVGAKEVTSTANAGSNIQWKHRAHL